MMEQMLRVGVAQTDCELLDVEANLDRAEACVKEARDRGVQLLLFPELSLSGYSVRNHFADASLRIESPQIRRLKSLSREMAIVVGFIEETHDVEFYNSAVFLSDGEIRHVHRKVYVPNYGIFDERRYFGAGWGVWAFDTPWTRMAILICGDCWHLSLPYIAVHDGANLLLILAASAEEGLSPSVSCQSAWERMNCSYALTLSTFVMFANRAGTEQDLHFWGGSHIIGPDGNFLARSQTNKPDLVVGELDFAALRKQRLVLPFRRDDSLALTIENARRVLHAKGRRRDGFNTSLHPYEPADRSPPGGRRPVIEPHMPIPEGRPNGHPPPG